MGHGPATGKDREVSSEPNVVPLCDILLVLLIIFMIVTPLIQKGSNITLPNAINTTEMPEDPQVVLFLDNQGKMYVNNDEATMDNLQLLVEAAIQEASDKTLYLRADKGIKFERIVDISLILRNASVDSIGIIVDRLTTEDNGEN